jgi:hypothetical protein
MWEIQWTEAGNIICHLLFQFTFIPYLFPFATLEVEQTIPARAGYLPIAQYWLEPSPGKGFGIARCRI